jgi:hypothetical protein
MAQITFHKFYHKKNCSLLYMFMRILNQGSVCCLVSGPSSSERSAHVWEEGPPPLHLGYVSPDSPHISSRETWTMEATRERAPLHILDILLYCRVYV